MSWSVSYRPSARLDLLEQFVYFAEEATLELAERYVAAVEATCLQLQTHPRLGTAYFSRATRLRELRRIPVQGFGQYLIFYLPSETGIDVLRILHGARDIENLLADMM